MSYSEACRVVPCTNELILCLLCIAVTSIVGNSEYTGENQYCERNPFRRQAHVGDRRVYVGNRPPPNEEVIIQEIYPKNRIISSRYTAWNFLPKNLFEQFRRIANFYFLVVGIVQLTIDTPVSPATSIVPLVFVITVTAIKQGYEDWLRHKSDGEVNNRDFQVVRDGQATDIKSMNIKVGDIVKVYLNKAFPCDLVMLSSQDPEGYCYINTANLDGETNLKKHCCLNETKRYQQDDDFTKLHAYIDCQQPIPDLYTFIGNLTVVKESGEILHKPLGPENVLLRGARLKNTPFIYGCAIYTGNETKMALNSKAKVTKFSRVERRMNTFLIIFLVILLCEATLSTCLKYWYVFRPNIGQPWYVPEIHKDAEVTARGVLEDFLAFVVLYNYVIPISLYVTVELQKFIGSMFFGMDIDLYDETTNLPAKANTSDLNEELGQVEYLFTDKTGTLTENDMQFRRCSINGRQYEELGGMLCECSTLGAQPTPVAVFSEEIETFLTILALCHNVRVDHPTAMSLGASAMYSYDGGFDYEYQASSPDEKAFVEACRRYGVVFHGIHDNRLEVTFKREMRRYKLLHSLEFDPTRKRMSVIIQNEKDEIYLLCKGAESAMLDRAVDGDTITTLQHINEYAMLGLRTLVLGIRRLSLEDYKQIDEKLSTARKSMVDREKKVAAVIDEVECDFKVIGATAVEDRLQEDVPETITALLAAGIKVWVLTGDKEETAVNISHSAGHFNSTMVELRITQLRSSLACAEQITSHMHRIENEEGMGNKFALIVDGMSLAFALTEHSSMLRKLCKKCSAVLCCRMTPLQKAENAIGVKWFGSRSGLTFCTSRSWSEMFANVIRKRQTLTALQKEEVVKLIKTADNHPVTAAIGDGANDVSMIQEADVGLGIMGKEGRQAVRNSDYAFARFKFLSKVLLVHGHFYYIRISNLVQYFFYKNVAFITAQIFFTFFSAFSQQSLYESFYLMFFNMVITALPILLYGIFEQHIQPKILLENPRLYKKISRNEALSVQNFILWNSLGLWHCVVCFFGAVLLIGEEVSLFQSGQMIGNWTLGSIVYFAVVIIVSLKLGLHIYYWSAPIFIAFLLSALAYFVGTTLYNSIWWPSFVMDHQYLYLDFNSMLQSITIWLAELMLIILALLPDIVYRTYRDINYHITLGRVTQTRRDSSLVPLRRLSSDKTTRFVYPNIPPAKATQDTPFLPLKSYSKRTDTQMKDNVL